MKHSEHHKRELKFMVGFIILFFIFFVIALINLWKGISVFGIMPYYIEDWLIIILSFLSILRILFNIIKH